MGSVKKILYFPPIPVQAGAKAGRLGRAPDFIMEPETYYEKFGLFIPNVIFPTGAVAKDGLLWIYYGF